MAITITLDALEVRELVEQFAHLTERRGNGAMTTSNNFDIAFLEAERKRLESEVAYQGTLLRDLADTYAAFEAKHKPGVDAQEVIDRLVPLVRELLAHVDLDAKPIQELWAQETRRLAHIIGDQVGEEG